MKKKNYLRPVLTIQTMETVQLIAASVQMGSSSQNVDTKGSGVQLENDRRGSWGNIWNED